MLRTHSEPLPFLQRDNVQKRHVESGSTSSGNKMLWLQASASVREDHSSIAGGFRTGRRLQSAVRSRASLSPAVADRSLQRAFDFELPHEPVLGNDRFTLYRKPGIAIKRLSVAPVQLSALSPLTHAPV